MRLESVRLHNVGPFEDFSLDLTSLGEARLIAIVGPNGSGKSTLLETALPGALFRSTPTRGSLVSLATARDSFVESRIVNGKAWTLRHSLDAISNKSEALVLDESGVPVLPDTKVRSFDSWAAQTFPEQSVLLSSVFGSQAGDGFLGAKPGDRKAILLRILGVERLERLAEQSRERGREASHELDVINARIAELGGVDVSAAEAALDLAGADAEAADKRLTTARTELDQARAQVAEVARVEERNAGVRRHRADLSARIEKAELDVTAAEAQLGQAQREVAGLDSKIRNNRGLLADREKIEAAVRHRDELAAELTTVDETSRSLSVQAEQLRADEKRFEREANQATSRGVQERQRAERLREELKRSEKGELAAQHLPERQTELDAAKAKLSEAEARLEEERGKRLAGSEERIADLRDALVDVGKSDDSHGDPAQVLAGAARLARHAIKADDDAVRLAASLPKAVRAAHARVTELRNSVDEVALHFAACQELAALAGRAEKDREALSDAEGQIAKAEQEAAECRTQASECRANLQRVNDKLEAAAEEEQRLRIRIEDLEPLVAKKPHLDVAEERIADRKAQKTAAEGRVGDAEARLVQARAAVTELKTQLSATPEPEAPPSAPTAREVVALEEAVADGERFARGAHASVSIAGKALEDANGAAVRAAELEDEKQEAESNVSDWKRLAADLGRTGLQAAEIDAAGPELTTLINDLLHSAHGPRWTVTIETQRLSADGKRTLEGCDVRVLDVERGRDTTAETLSGGERVIVGEAVSLALSMLACRRAGMERPTLVRDESGAALDGKAARAYVAMLRRAAELVDADRVLLVSHTPEVWSMCDAEVRLQ